MDTNQTWYVRSEGGPTVGPVETERVVRAILAGKIPIDSQVRAEHNGTWLELAAVPQFAEAVRKFTQQGPSGDAGGAPAPAPSPEPPPAPPPSRAPSPSNTSSGVLRTAALFVVPTVAAALLFGRKGEPPPSEAPTSAQVGQASQSLGYPLEKLPPRTTSITASRLRPDRDDLGALPPGLVASSLSKSVCGGRDLVADIARLKGRELPALEAAGAFRLSTDERLAAELECGETVRSKLASDRVLDLEFLEGEAQRHVRLVKATIENMPAGIGFVKHVFSGLDGYCVHPKDAIDDCPAGTHALVRDGAWWAVGTFEAVRAFAHAAANPKTELSSSVDLLASALAAAPPGDIVRAYARPKEVPWRDVCTAVAPKDREAEFLRACLYEGMDVTVKSIDAKAKAVAVSLAFLGGSQRYQTSYTILARDDARGLEVQNDAIDLTTEWRSHVRNREPELVRVLGSGGSSHEQRLWASVMESFIHALQAPKVERTGRVVRVTLEAALEEGEKKAFREFTEARKSVDEAALSVAEAIRTKAAIPEGPLATLIGADFAAWALVPRSTEADCAAAAEKLKALPATPASPNAANLATFFGEPKKCVGVPWPKVWTECLAAATDAVAFGACSLPETPFEFAAQKRVEGQWQLDATAASQEARNAFQALPTKLELKRGQIASLTGDRPTTGLANTSASSLQLIEVALPTGPRGLTFRVDEAVPDVLVVAGTDKGGAKPIVYRRTSFTSLFLPPPEPTPPAAP